LAIHSEELPSTGDPRRWPLIAKVAEGQWSRLLFVVDTRTKHFIFLEARSSLAELLLNSQRLLVHLSVRMNQL
jgi:hypothetical protein